MTDRVVRDEILQSGRWLDLPTDTDRLAFFGLMLICDDFGNLEGGSKRLFRFLHGFTQVKTEEAAITTLMHLADADMARRYEVAGREYWHIPRLRPHRQYLSRKVPASPWDDDRPLGKNKRVKISGLAKNHELGENLAATSQRHSSDVAEGVGVGVGVGVNQLRTSAAAPVDNSAPNATSNPQSWAQFWTQKGKALGIEPKAGESTGEYCRRVQRGEKDR